MSRTYEELESDYAELAQQSGKMCRVAELFSDKVKNPEWATGLLDEVETTRRLLVKAPAPHEWDGELHEQDLEIEFYRAPQQDVRAEAVGVKITHKPTGIGGESYSQTSRLANTETVMTYLRRKVSEYYQSQQ